MPRSTIKLKLNSKLSKCPLCLETFSTEHNFNKHKVGEYNKGRACANPEDVGLVLMETTAGSVWKMPPSEDKSFYSTMK